MEIVINKAPADIEDKEKDKSHYWHCTWYVTTREILWISPVSLCGKSNKPPYKKGDIGESRRVVTCEECKFKGNSYKSKM